MRSKLEKYIDESFSRLQNDVLLNVLDEIQKIKNDLKLRIETELKYYREFDCFFEKELPELHKKLKQNFRERRCDDE